MYTKFKFPILNNFRDIEKKLKNNFFHHPVSR